jgi:hypothetical protein
MEEWRDVVEYEGLYEVSSLGRVRRNGSVITPWLAGGTGDRWYNYVSLSKQGVVKKKRVNILVATAFISNPSNLPIVDHINGVATNDRVENLEWKTRRGNFLNPTNKVRPVGKSGHKCIFPNHEKWMVRCMVNGATHYVGTFKTLEEAIRARDDFLS